MALCGATGGQLKRKQAGPAHRDRGPGPLARPVELPILFGSYARGDWVEDLVNGYLSDFDLMAVVAPRASQEPRPLGRHLRRAPPHRRPQEVMSRHVLDLAARARTACAAKLRGVSPTGEIPELSAAPAMGEVAELPELPDLRDVKAVEAWREAVAQMSYERGHRTGHETGFGEGHRTGRLEGFEQGQEAGILQGRQEEQARAIAEVLRRRGIPLSDESAQKIATCRDQATLTHWWDRAWSISSADDLWD